MTKLLEFVFSIKNKDIHKIVTLFGIKLKLKDKKKELVEKLRKEFNTKIATERNNIKKNTKNHSVFINRNFRNSYCGTL